MAKGKHVSSAGLAALVEMIPVYETAVYGSSSPKDWKLPLSVLGRRIRGAMTLPHTATPESFFGESLLQLLVSAKRAGLDIRNVLEEAARDVVALQGDYEAELARLADDGNPNGG